MIIAWDINKDEFIAEAAQTRGGRVPGEKCRKFKSSVRELTRGQRIGGESDWAHWEMHSCGKQGMEV